MAEQANEQATEATATQQQAAAPAPETDYKALYEQLKAESRKWEERAKANVEKAKAYDELQAQANAQAQANKSLEEQVADIRNQLNASNVANARLKVASEKGVPADLIFGSTEQEMRDAADAILKFRETAAPKPTAPIIPADGNTPENIAKPDEYVQAVHNFFGGN